MRHRSKIKSMRIVLQLIVGLTSSLFVLGFSNSLNAEGFTLHKGRFWKPEPVSCGDTITSYALLTTDLDCSDTESTALRLEEGAKLNLNGKKVIGNFGINCIDIRGNGTKIWHGTVTQCDYGIRVRSDRNRIMSVEVSDSADRGIRIDGDENLVINCSVAYNGTQGIKINGGNRNKIFSNRVFDNCRDGIEIDEGKYNWVFYNHVEDNGNREVCDNFAKDPTDPEDSYYYKPWFYAGIDVLSGSENNRIKHNRAGCNLGCVGSDDFPCTAHERDFWDENVDTSGNCASNNEWENNSIACKNAVAECSPNPNPPD